MMARMSQSMRQLLFLLFFLSGFCSLVYQVIWTRLAFASFGIITPVLSVVLSVFMLGLAAGSWVGGRCIAPLVRKTGVSAAVFYAGAELLIGLGAFAVPKLFAAGERLLLAVGQTNSLGYLFLSAMVLAVSLLPWCVCMGTTFPFMVAYIWEQDRQNASSFSFLYLANVLGAMSGTFLTAIVLVEMFGFHHTLWVAAAGNFIIAAISVGLGWRQWALVSIGTPEERSSEAAQDLIPPNGFSNRLIKWILFLTGFSAMAMEVVWTRAFTPILKTQVYSFALIVFTYLGATFMGSLWYRYHLRKNSLCSIATLIALLAVASFLPGVVNDPKILNMDWGYKVYIGSAIIMLASIVPLCALLGYLTPSLIDEYAGGHPSLAGEAYAINVLGCILGPLFAGYVLLPWMSERCALMILSLPFFGFYFLGWKSLPFEQRMVSGLGAGMVAIYSLFLADNFQDLVLTQSSRIEVRRDYAASVISAAPMDHKLLLVNGIGMTELSPTTKFMAHLPLAFHQGQPQSALIICFGMGTTYRSALSWDVNTTTVELVPGVAQAFGFYHADAKHYLGNPKGRIVIDDGRRYLRRTAEKFDVIVIDPPPPPEAAGSSLLYSREFYELAKQHLQPHGILQTWVPGGDVTYVSIAQAALRSLSDSFPYTRIFFPVEGTGIHLLASMEPIELLDAGQLTARMPAAAKRDLLEWSDSPDVTAYFGRVVTNEVDVARSLNPNRAIQITDDRPYNEYFLLRQWKLITY